jgi:carbonic anhydrase
MPKSLQTLVKGYQAFREKYVLGDNTFMKNLSEKGQAPEIIVVACCDSRVDPALLLQCDPGDLFIVRNVANIIPPYEHDALHHGTSAALEFGVCYLKAKDLVILGHSQCGGVEALLNQDKLPQDDFISNWIGQIHIEKHPSLSVDDCAKASLINSYKNVLSFPWIKERIEQGTFSVHLWFFNIKDGLIYAYEHHNENNQGTFKPLTAASLSRLV